MALKKPMKRPTPKTTTSPSTSEAKATAVTKPAPRRAVPPPARKPVAPPVKKPIIPTEKKSPIMEPPPSAPKKQRPVRKPAPKAPEPAKEVKPVEQEKPEVKQEEQREVRKSPEAPKPAPAAGSDRGSTEFRRTGTTADDPKRYPAERLKMMELEERYKAWKALNTDPEKFVPLLAQLPRQMQMRKNEAVLREIVTPKPPKTKNLLVFYCPYCVDWQVFHNHSWTGYTKCTGCSISSKDFYTAVDNGVFGKE